jgi:hypothetical protein
MRTRAFLSFVVIVGLACALCPPGAGAEEYPQYWAKRFGDASAQDCLGIATDSHGNVFITGYFRGTVNFGGGPLAGAGTDIYIAKFDPLGNHLWSKRFGDAGIQVARGIAVDMATDRVVITGYFAGSVDFGGGALTSKGSWDIFVAKFDGDGTHVWSKAFGDADSQTGEAVAVQSSGEVAITGTFYGTVNFGLGDLTSAGQGDVYIAYLDRSGKALWNKRFGDATYQLAFGMVFDHAGSVILVGAFEGP